MAFSKLPKLKAPETNRVTARVIDTFYRPEKEPLDGTPLLLAEGLERFNSGLSKYITVKEEIKEEVDTKKATADYNKNRAEFKTLIKNGTLPEGASPYYINAYVNAELKDKARGFQDDLFSAWQNGAIKNDLNEGAFGQFYTSFSKEWFKTNGLESYDKVNIAESFIPMADAYRSQLESQHIQGRITLIEDNQKNLLAKETNNLINDAFEMDMSVLSSEIQNVDLDGIDEIDQRLIWSSLAIKEKLDGLVNDGMKPATANKVVIDSIVNKALAENDIEVLGILNNIVTDNVSGAKLGDTVYGKKLIENTTSKILDKEIQVERYNEWKTTNINTKQSKEDLDNFFSHIIDGNGIDVEEFIKTYRRDNGTAITDGGTANTLRQFASGWMTAQDVVDEDDFLISTIQLDIYQQPLKSNIVRRINEAMFNKDINSKTGEALLQSYFNSQKNIETGYFNNKGFQRLEKGLEKFMMKGGIMLDGSAESLLDDAYIELYRYANRVITDLETNEKYKGMGAFDREEIFMDKMAIHQRKLKIELEETDAGEGDVNAFDNSGVKITKPKFNVFDN